MLDLDKYIAVIEDFPVKGIMFRDITPLLLDGEAFNYATDKLAAYAKDKGATVIVGPESRGFIFGCPVANKLNIGFVPIRKPGKLPREVFDIDISEVDSQLEKIANDIELSDYISNKKQEFYLVCTICLPLSL